MRFITRKRRQPPAVILISLIDILLVLLIFLVMTTTFKRYPALQLTLPEAKAPSPQGREAIDLLVTIDRESPHLYLGKKSVSLEALEQTFRETAEDKPEARLAVRADQEAPLGIMVQVMEAAGEAGLRPNVDVMTRRPEDLP